MPSRNADQLALDMTGGAAKRRRVARVRRAVDAQLAAQRRLGHLEPVDDGLVAIARTLADALDAEWTDADGSRFTVGALAGRLVPVLLELRGERRADGAGLDAELVALAAAIRDAAESRARHDGADDAGAPDTPTTGGAV